MITGGLGVAESVYVKDEKRHNEARTVYLSLLTLSCPTLCRHNMKVNLSLLCALVQSAVS